jgi:hypothetical protein
MSNRIFLSRALALTRDHSLTLAMNSSAGFFKDKKFFSFLFLVHKITGLQRSLYSAANKLTFYSEAFTRNLSLGQPCGLDHGGRTNTMAWRWAVYVSRP